MFKYSISWLSEKIEQQSYSSTIDNIVFVVFKGEKIL